MVIAPVINGNVFVDANGRTLQGSVWTYIAGSFTVPKEAFIDVEGTPAPNPTSLNSGGVLPLNLYLSPGEGYNLVVRDAAGEVFTFVDNIIVGDTE
jgi:hypothetical protein